MDEPKRAYRSPLRERQAEQTRNDILDALTRLLADRRADEITTRELAAEAEVSERTVYRHFVDRAALVEGLSARFETVFGPGPTWSEDLDDLAPMAIALMQQLELHAVEASAEALFNADPRRFSEATSEHTVAFREVVGRSLPALADDEAHALAAVLRVLMSSQTWLRLREEHGLTGDVSGPVVGWAVDALLREAASGSPPPATSPRAARRRRSATSRPR